jgi:hypothetical protein
MEHRHSFEVVTELDGSVIIFPCSICGASWMTVLEAFKMDGVVPDLEIEEIYDARL